MEASRAVFLSLLMDLLEQHRIIMLTENANFWAIPQIYLIRIKPKKSAF